MRAEFNDRILIGDGAMGTYLYQLGVPIGISFEELNLTNPKLIERVHRDYIDAGARLLQTNTYRANREHLAHLGLDPKVEEMNRAAVQIARNAAAESDALVAGTIGGLREPRRKRFDDASVADNVKEQLDVFLSEEVDALLLETYFDPDELLLVLDLVRKKTDIPVICQLSFYEDGRLHDVFTELKRRGADAAGLNCRTGPSKIIETFEKLPEIPELAFSAYPNAGLPDYVDGRYEYAATPEYFGQSALRLREQGVRLIGGCCGTTPAHVRKMAQVLGGLGPLTEKKVREHKQPALKMSEPPKAEAAETDHRRWKEPTLADTARRRHTIIVELDPPKHLQYEKFLRGCEELRDAGVDAVTMADNSLAVTRMSNMALGAIVKERIGVRPLLHVACRDRNLIAQQSHLMGLHALGVDHVLAVTGDPARFGDFPGATSVYDLTSFDMIRLMKQMNRGESHSGRNLGTQTNFTVSAAFNPNVKNIERGVSRLERKVEAGADYIMTQPIYSVDQVETIYQATKHVDVPIFVGVMPLASSRNAEFIHNEIPGIKLSDDVRRRMANVEGEQARSEGVAIAREVIDAAIERFHGIYLITPFMRYEMTAELTRYMIQNTKRYSRTAHES